MNLNGGEVLLLIVIAVIVIGPERLPQYAEQLATLVRNIKKVATGATERVKEELGEEAAYLDLSQFDPRKYDPRRIVRDALREDIKPVRRAPTGRTRTQAGAPIRDKTTVTTAPKAATAAAAGAAAAAGTTTMEDHQDTDAGAVAETPRERRERLAAERRERQEAELALSGAPFDDEAT